MVAHVEVRSQSTANPTGNNSHTPGRNDSLQPAGSQGRAHPWVKDRKAMAAMLDFPEPFMAGQVEDCCAAFRQGCYDLREETSHGSGGRLDEFLRVRRLDHGDPSWIELKQGHTGWIHWHMVP